MRTTCTRNLTKHIQLLKTQRNKLLTLHLNGYKISNEMKQEYLDHLSYTKKLYQSEKFKYFNSLINTNNR